MNCSLIVIYFSEIFFLYIKINLWDIHFKIRETNKGFGVTSLCVCLCLCLCTCAQARGRPWLLFLRHCSPRVGFSPFFFISQTPLFFFYCIHSQKQDSLQMVLSVHYVNPKASNQSLISLVVSAFLEEPSCWLQPCFFSRVFNL